MISYWGIWLLTRIDEIKALVSNCGMLKDAYQFSGIVFVIMGVVLAIAFAIGFFCGSNFTTAEKETYDKCYAGIKKAFKWVFCIFAITFVTYGSMRVLSVLIPTRNEAAVIYIVPTVLNSDFVQKDLPAESKEMYNLAKTWLKGMTDKAPKTSDIKGLVDQSLEAGKTYTKDEVTKIIINQLPKIPVEIPGLKK